MEELCLSQCRRHGSRLTSDSKEKNSSQGSTDSEHRRDRSGSGYALGRVSIAVKRPMTLATLSKRKHLIGALLECQRFSSHGGKQTKWCADRQDVETSTS